MDVKVKKWPKNVWMYCVTEDMLRSGVDSDMPADRNVWKISMYCVDPP